jgi:hypothetical protein
MQHPVQIIEGSNLREAQALRDSADRFEIRGDIVTAQLFRNSAWRIEHGHEWLDDINVREASNDRP